MKTPTTPVMAYWECHLAEESDDKPHTGYLSYLGEGAANAVFKIQEQHPSSGDFVKIYFTDEDRLLMQLPSTSLLRFAKNNIKTIGAKDTIYGLEDHVRPLFGVGHAHFLLQHELIRVSQEVVQSVAELLEKQKHRCQSGSIVPTDKDAFAILIRDMSSIDGEALTIEFKPKWLVNSPAQSRLSYRCRTCAMRAYQLSNDSLNKIETPTMCPLDLLAGNTDVIGAFVRSSMMQKLGRLDTKLMDALTGFLAVGEGHTLIDLLAHLQVHLDPDYPGEENEERREDEEEADHSRRLAMTLRDCSMYVRIWYKYEPPVIECALADLDFKHEDKIPDWETKENMLKSGGWYMGKEKGRDMPDPMEQCALARYFRNHCPWHW